MNRIVVVRHNGLILSIEYCDGEPVRIFPSREESVSLGSIYVGRISKVKQELNAVFVDFQPGVTGFLPIHEVFGTPKEGQILTVRVVNEPVKTKGYTLSTHLEISGKYCVVTDKTDEIHFSSKLSKNATSVFADRLPIDYPERVCGGIIRTNASPDNYENFLAEFKKLDSILSDIVKYKDTRTLYSCLYEEMPSFVKSLTDLKEGSFDEIITEEQDLYEKLSEVFHEKTKLFDNSNISVEARYRVLHAIDLATKKKVDLPCGGYLYIEPTEALTVIDVNSGKFDVKKKRSEMIKKVNYEAADAVARQLMLRNISGMIIVDFINFDDPEEEAELTTYMRKLLKKDLVRCKVYGMSALKFMEIARQKTRASIYDFL